MFKLILSLLRRRIFRIPVYVILALIILIGGIVIWRVIAARNAVPLTTVTATRGTVREEVSVVGRVQPTERLDLSLQGSGRIAFVGTTEGARVKRGQTLVSLSNENLQAQLASAQASLDQQQIRLNQLVDGARSEDIAVTRANTDVARSTRDNAERSFSAQLRQSYTSVDSAFGANIDQFFTDANSDNPHFGVNIHSSTGNYSIGASSADKSRLESEQIEMNKRMKAWNDALLGTDTSATALAANSAVAYAQTYLSDLAGVVNSYQPSSSGEQAVYDAFKGAVSSARNTVNTADGALTTSQSTRASASSSLAVAERQLDLKTAPAQSSDVQIQEAVVRAAAANVALVRANIALNAVVSPVDGIVTELPAKVGESASPTKPVVTVMADARIEIVAKVPEADIAKIAVGNEARMTLDAYPGESFKTHVIYVAPAETLVDGVATYKVKLQLDQDDARLKAGMSTDMDISTQTRENVILLPQRAILTRTDKKVVRIPDGSGNKTREVEVKVGIRGVDGMVEIISGVTDGEVVVTGSTTP